LETTVVLLRFSCVPGFVYQQQSKVFTREVKLEAVFRHVRVVDLVHLKLPIVTYRKTRLSLIQMYDFRKYVHL
jgi:hypothetical protein